MRRKHHKLVLIRIAVVMLLASLAGFSTLAKNTQYLPKSNPARYLSIASKMKADCSPVTVEPPPVQPRVRVLPPQPVAFSNHLEEQETQFVERIGISVSVRHRAPPFHSPSTITLR